MEEAANELNSNTIIDEDDDNMTDEDPEEGQEDTVMSRNSTPSHTSQARQEEDLLSSRDPLTDNTQ